MRNHYLMTLGNLAPGQTTAQIPSMPNSNPQGDQLIQNTLPTDGLTRMLGIAGTAVGAYHGYKRNNSVGWAVAWAFLGGLVPIITVPVALAQGLGKPKED